MKLTDDQMADIGDQLSTMLGDLDITLPSPASTISAVVKLIAAAAIEPATGDRAHIIAGRFVALFGTIVEREESGTYLVRIDPAPGSQHVTGPTVRVSHSEILVIA